MGRDTLNISDESLEIIRKHYNPSDVRTWPFFPIIMPLKNGTGPATYEECDQITYEVWDLLFDTHGSFIYMPDAINKAMELSKRVLDN